MTELFTDGSTEEALVAAEGSLRDARCVVFPTDTVYGVGARPDVPAATARIFEVKRRPRDLTLPVLAAGVEDAGRVARLDERAFRLADRFWPGALTLVLPRTAASADWDLGAERETVGVRVPAHPIAAALLSRSGPLAVTSANVSGRPTPATCEEVRAELEDGVEVYLCDDTQAEPVPSTVVVLLGGEPRILRRGALPPEEVFGALEW